MEIHDKTIVFDNGFILSFERTLRIPEDGKEHGLPASCGSFPIKRVEDYKTKVPASWVAHGGVFICMYQREAMWMNFRAVKPVAVKVACGKINAISGKPWKTEIQSKTVGVSKDPQQDYVVVHNSRYNGTSQPWLDGFNTSKGTVKQFVAMPLGGGYTVEAQVTGKEDVGGIQILTYPSKKGAIKDPKPLSFNRGSVLYSSSLESTMDSYPISAVACATRRMEMGLGEGGEITQKIYESEYDVDVWDQSAGEKVFVHIVNSVMYREITGEDPPTTPITRKMYEFAGYAWYELYDESAPSISGSGALANIKTISEIDKEKNLLNQEDHSLLQEKITVKIPWSPPKVNPNEITNGDW